MFKITYWDAYDGTAIRVIEGGEEEMNTLDVEPSGEAFVSGGDDGLVKVSGRLVARFLTSFGECGTGNIL